MPIFAVVLVLIILVVLYVVGIYNSLASMKTQIKASIQEIGNQLKRQASLIPNLESAAKSYLKHEQGIFELLAKARQSVTTASSNPSGKNVDAAIDKIQAVLPKLSVVMESNPDIKASETINKFMDELTDTSDKLMYARRSLIDLTQNYNAKLVTFPSNLIASSLGFKEEAGLVTPTSGAHLEVSEAETKDVKVNL